MMLCIDPSQPPMKHLIQQYLLEVLQHNSSAVRLYKKLGFEITRSFNYFHQDAQQVKVNSTKLDGLKKVKSIPLQTAQDLGSGDFYASWQNSVCAMERSPEDFSAIGFTNQGRLLGSLICDPQTGDITQILVDPEHPRKEIGTALVYKALQVNEHNEVKLINTDIRDTGLTKFLELLHIPLQGKQYEMIKKFYGQAGRRLYI